jgi:hypothetical protein
MKWLYFTYIIAALCFSTGRSFSTRSPISERRYLDSGWSFMELLPAQYWIFVSMWHCFSRLEFTKGIWWKEPKDEWRLLCAKLMFAAIWKRTELMKRIETQMWMWGSLFSFIFFLCSHFSVLFSISFHVCFTSGTHFPTSTRPHLFPSLIPPSPRPPTCNSVKRSFSRALVPTVFSSMYSP